MFRAFLIAPTLPLHRRARASRSCVFGSGRSEARRRTRCAI